jgi:hypothetical protein
MPITKHPLKPDDMGDKEFWSRRRIAQHEAAKPSKENAPMEQRTELIQQWQQGLLVPGSHLHQ